MKRILTVSKISSQRIKTPLQKELGMHRARMMDLLSSLFFLPYRVRLDLCPSTTPARGE